MKKLFMYLLFTLLCVSPVYALGSPSIGMSDNTTATTAADLICTDCVDDTEIDWGTGAGQVSFADIPGDFAELQSATPAKTLVNEEDAVIWDNSHLWEKAGLTGYVFSGNSTNGYLRISHNDEGSLPGTIASATVLVIDRTISTNSSSYVSIISGTTGTTRLQFGDTDNEDAGYFSYSNATDSWTFGSSGANRILTLASGANHTIDVKDAGTDDSDGFGIILIGGDGGSGGTGNHNGGNIVLSPGAGAGSGTTGELRFSTVVSCANLQTDADGDVSCNATDYLTEAELDTMAELQTQIADATVLDTTQIDTSAELAGILGDETGSGVVVFGTSPQFTTSMTFPTGAAFGITMTSESTNDADGSDLTITGANAGSGGTGNHNGGDVIIVPGSDQGTGVKGYVDINSGQVALPHYQQVIADSGDGNPATDTLDVEEASVFEIVCSDVDGCTLTIGEITGRNGAVLTIYQHSGSTGNITVNDSAGVSELAGAWTANGAWDSLSLVYTGSRWLETGRSDN